MKQGRTKMNGKEKKKGKGESVKFQNLMLNWACHSFLSLKRSYQEKDSNDGYQWVTRSESWSSHGRFPNSFSIKQNDK